MGAPRIPHQPAFDGVRGVAVAGILLFHSPFAWARGAFLGVSTFFTLSGFLITTLLLAERGASGRIDLRRFWARRIRRLMPAELLGLGGVLAYGVWLAHPDQLARLRGDALAALAYAANWRFVWTQYSYTALFTAPSPVLHFWSLSIEGQFYAVYPLLLGAVLGAARGSRLALGIALAALAAASLALSQALYASAASLDRIYFGTDTRAAEFAVGGLLALILGPSGAGSPRVRRAADAAGVAALGLGAWLWSQASLDSAWTYRGGLGLHARASAALVAAATQPHGIVRGLLSWRPLCWLGRISYGVYVYHWPVFLWLDEERTGLGGPALLALRLALVLPLAAVSYRFVEEPIRRGRTLAGRRPWLVAPLAAAALALALVAVTRNAPAPLDLREVAIPPPGARSGADPGPPRIAVFGDSTAFPVERGLFRWLEEGERGVPSGGFKRAGCGIADVGWLRARRRPKSIDPWCMRLVELHWAAAVEEHDPDVALVVLGTWDLRDRRFFHEKQFREPGDPLLDDYLRDEVGAAVDALSARGATVVWLTIPPQAGARRPEAKPARVTRWSEILREVEALRPGRLRVLDLAGYEAQRAREGEEPLARPDGVHLSPEAAYALAAAWLGPELLRVHADASRRAATAPAGPLPRSGGSHTRASAAASRTSRPAGDQRRRRRSQRSGVSSRTSSNPRPHWAPGLPSWPSQPAAHSGSEP